MYIYRERERERCIYILQEKTCVLLQEEMGHWGHLYELGYVRLLQCGIKGEEVVPDMYYIYIYIHVCLYP